MALNARMVLGFSMQFTREELPVFDVIEDVEQLAEKHGLICFRGGYEGVIPDEIAVGFELACFESGEVSLVEFDKITSAVAEKTSIIPPAFYDELLVYWQENVIVPQLVKDMPDSTPQVHLLHFEN